MLACGTCLTYLELKDRVAAGTVSNMYTILETLIGAGGDLSVVATAHIRQAAGDAENAEAQRTAEVGLDTFGLLPSAAQAALLVSQAFRRRILQLPRLSCAPSTPAS